MGDGKAETYWAAVRKEAWEASSQHFAWRYPVLAAAIVYAFTVAFLGPQRAVEELATTLIAGGAAVVVALGGRRCFSSWLWPSSSISRGRRKERIGEMFLLQ